MGSVNANLSISFSALVDGAEDDGTNLELEVNGADNIKNGEENTSFTFSDTAYYRVYKGANITSVRFISSESNVDSAHASGQTAQIVDEIVTFVNTNTANTQYPIESGLTATLLAGTSIGNLGWTAGSSGLEGTPAGEGADPIVAVYKVSYTTKFDLRKVSGVTAPAAWPADTAYPILIVAVGIYT